MIKQLLFSTLSIIIENEKDQYNQLQVAVCDRTITIWEYNKNEHTIFLSDIVDIHKSPSHHYIYFTALNPDSCRRYIIQFYGNEHIDLFESLITRQKTVNDIFKED